MTEASEQAMAPPASPRQDRELALIVLVKDMAWGGLAAKRATASSQADFYSSLGMLSLQARQATGFTPSPSQARGDLDTDWTILQTPLGAKNISPLVLPDGSILTTICPGDTLARFANAGDRPEPYCRLPGRFHAKALGWEEVWLVTHDGARVARLDLDLGGLRGFIDLEAVGVCQTTALCRRANGVAACSWKEKTVRFLDADWRPERHVHLPLADFLMSPVDAGAEVLVVNTPRCAVGDGEVLGISPSGRVRCLVDGLDCPTGLAATEELVLCADREGLRLFSRQCVAASVLTVPYLDLIPDLRGDETVSVGTMHVRERQAYLFTDISPKDIANCNRTGLLRISLASLERFWQGGIRVSPGANAAPGKRP